MPTTKINGCLIHYQQLGEGPDLVLVHGLLGNLAFWYFSVVPLLMQNFRVCVYDMRGHGHSEMPPSGYRSADMAEDLRCLMEHLGIKQTHLAGHSFGGAVALHFAAHYPERVHSLTLADAWIPALQRPFRRGESEYWKLLQGRLRQAGVRLPGAFPVLACAIIEEAIRAREALGFAGRRYGRQRVEFMNAIAKHCADLAKATQLRKEVCEVGDLSGARISQIAKPVLAMFGQNSPCLPSMRGLQKNLRNCQVVLAPGAGHFHPRLQPDSFARNLKRFALENRA